MVIVIVMGKRAKTNLEVLGDFTDKTLEGELPDQELGGPASKYCSYGK